MVQLVPVEQGSLHNILGVISGVTSVRLWEGASLLLIYTILQRSA